MRGYWVGVLGLGLVFWACSSDEGGSGGGNGGSGGSAGAAGAAGVSGGGSGGDSDASAGSAGTSTGGTGGTATDAGMDVELDVYVYAPCEEGCTRVLTECGGTAMDIEECAVGCTSDSLGPCGDQLKALIACVQTSEIQCNGTQWTPVDCGTEFQTFQTCSDAQN